MGYYPYYNYWNTLNLAFVDGYIPPFRKEICGQTRAYRFEGNSSIYGAEVGKRVYWGLVVNNGREFTSFEIIYKFPYSDKIEEKRWSSFKYDSLYKLFHIPGKRKDKFSFMYSDKISEAWDEAVKVIDVDGRGILQFPTSFVKGKMYGVNKDNIRESMPAKVIEVFEDVMGIALEHPKCVKCIADAQNILNAIREVRDVGWKIWGKKFEEDKDDYQHKIKEDEKTIDLLNSEFQRCCDLAAESMNRLSSTYGIDVQL